MKISFGEYLMLGGIVVCFTGIGIIPGIFLFLLGCLICWITED